MPLLQGQGGPVQVGDGLFANARLDSFGALVVSDFHGLWAEETLRGNCFTYSTTTAASITALGNNLPTLWNPSGSGKICILSKLTLQAGAVGTPVTSGLQYGFLENCGSSISTTAPVITFTLVAARNMNIGGGPRKSSAMLWGPAVNTFTAAPSLLCAAGIDLGSTSTFTPFTAMDEINGRIIIWPGGLVQVAASTATSTTFNVSLFGVELAVPNIAV